MLLAVTNQRSERTRKYQSYCSPSAAAISGSTFSGQTHRNHSVSCGSREHRLSQLKQQRKKAVFQRRIRNTFCAVILMVFLGIVLSGFAGMRVLRVPVYKYYTAVTVQRDDTLWAIAQANRTEEYPSVNSYIKEIKEVNNMKSDHVYYGQKLILPYYSTSLK